MSEASDTNENKWALLALARKRFPDLSDAEKILLRKTAAGEAADFSTANDEENKPAQADNWGEGRRLRSELIAWLCTDPEASELVTHRGVQVIGARVEGPLDLSFAQMPFPLGLFRSSLPGGIDLVDASIRVLALDGSCSGPITADRMKVDGDVSLQKGFKAEGEVRLLGATIGGQLGCSKGHFSNPKGYALNADGMKVGGGVFLQKDFKAEGEVRLLGAEIGGQLSCRNGHFTKPDDNPEDDSKDKSEGYALNAGGVKVGGGVFLDEKFEAEGEVCLLGAEIGGNLECKGGHFSKPKDKPKHKPEGFALNADGMKVEGDVFLTDGFTAKGEVRLLGATIGGNLECTSSEFANPKGTALNAEQMEVRGHVLFRKGAKFHGRVNLESANIGRNLAWMGIESPETAILDLRRAKCVALLDEESSWPSTGNLFLDGFVYKSIDERAPQDAASRIKWLRRQPRGQFLPQPYEQLAEVLRKSGHEEEAKKILIQKATDRPIEKEPSWKWPFRWLLKRLFSLSVGYGYRPWKAFWIGIIFIALGTGLFWFGSYKGVMCETKLMERTVTVGDTNTSVPPDYPKFIPWFYSLDLFIPLINLRQADCWAPNANKEVELSISEHRMIPVASFLIYYSYFHTLFGWLITTLFIVSVSGLLKR